MAAALKIARMIPRCENANATPGKRGMVLNSRCGNLTRRSASASCGSVAANNGSAPSPFRAPMLRRARRTAGVACVAVRSFRVPATATTAAGSMGVITGTTGLLPRIPVRMATTSFSTRATSTLTTTVSRTTTFQCVSSRSQVRTQIMRAVFKAYYSARKNKRNTCSQSAFERKMATELINIVDDIFYMRYSVGRSVVFMVHRPVKREVFAACFQGQGDTSSAVSVHDAGVRADVHCGYVLLHQRSRQPVCRPAA